jgi:hypothetical protein
MRRRRDAKREQGEGDAGRIAEIVPACCENAEGAREQAHDHKGENYREVRQQNQP